MRPLLELVKLTVVDLDVPKFTVFQDMYCHFMDKYGFYPLSAIIASTLCLKPCDRSLGYLFTERTLPRELSVMSYFLKGRYLSDEESLGIPAQHLADFHEIMAYMSRRVAIGLSCCTRVLEHPPTLESVEVQSINRRVDIVDRAAMPADGMGWLMYTFNSLGLYESIVTYRRFLQCWTVAGFTQYGWGYAERCCEVLRRPVSNVEELREEWLHDLVHCVFRTKWNGEKGMYSGLFERRLRNVGISIFGGYYISALQGQNVLHGVYGEVRTVEEDILLAKGLVPETPPWEGACNVLDRSLDSDEDTEEECDDEDDDEDELGDLGLDELGLHESDWVLMGVPGQTVG